MLRLHDWNERLVSWANSVNGKAFKWGRTDCYCLARDSQATMYGTDLLLDVAKYRTSASALKAGRQVGPVNRYLRDRGYQAVLPNFAQSGDVVVFKGLDRGHPQVGVVVTGRLLVSTPEEGVVMHRLPTGDAWPKGVKLWRAPQDDP